MDDDEAGGGQGQDGQVPVDGLGEGGLGLDHAGDDLLLPRGQSEGVKHQLGVVAGELHLLRQIDGRVLRRLRGGRARGRAGGRVLA